MSMGDRGDQLLMETVLNLDGYLNSTQGSHQCQGGGEQWLSDYQSLPYPIRGLEPNEQMSPSPLRPTRSLDLPRRGPLLFTDQYGGGDALHFSGVGSYQEQSSGATTTQSMQTHRPPLGTSVGAYSCNRGRSSISSSYEHSNFLGSAGAGLTKDSAKGGQSVRGFGTNQASAMPPPPVPSSFTNSSSQGGGIPGGAMHHRLASSGLGRPPPLQRLGNSSGGFGTSSHLLTMPVSNPLDPLHLSSAALARTSSAPPLGMLLDGLEPETGTLPLSPLSVSPARPSMSAASSPDQSGRQLSGGLPRTMLSRTISCPPLSAMNFLQPDGSELTTTESEDEGSAGQLEGTSSGQEDSGLQRNTWRTAELARNKRKRMLLPKSPEGTKSTTSLGASEEESKNEEGETEGNQAGQSKESKDMPKRPEVPKPEPPKDYIHVRARRGQATDSHSLAERVRREKISERMKVLQDLVPTCAKVTGKATMLDEIINYVRSLQLQVEVLSKKLAAITNGNGNVVEEDVLKQAGCEDNVSRGGSPIAHQVLTGLQQAPRQAELESPSSQQQKQQQQHLLNQQAFLLQQLQQAHGDHSDSSQNSLAQMQLHSVQNFSFDSLHATSHSLEALGLDSYTAAPEHLDADLYSLVHSYQKLPFNNATPNLQSHPFSVTDMGSTGFMKLEPQYSDLMQQIRR